MTRNPQPTSPSAPAPAAGTLSVVIPVYNEKDTWRDLLERVEAVTLPGLKMQIVLVEDGSKDGTREQLEEFAAGCASRGGGRIAYKVIFHPHNRGKGAALRTGFAAADGDLVIIQDADLEYDPTDYPIVLQPLLDGETQVCYGSRFLAARSRKGYLKNYLANKVLTWLSNLTTGWKLTDMETCYKAFRREVIQSVELEQDRFGFEPEVTAKLAKTGAAVCEVPIRYNARTHSEGKKIGWKDGFKAIWCILKYGLRSRSVRPVFPSGKTSRTQSGRK